MGVLGLDAHLFSIENKLDFILIDDLVENSPRLKINYYQSTKPLFEYVKKNYCYSDYINLSLDNLINTYVHYNGAANIVYQLNNLDSYNRYAISIDYKRKIHFNFHDQEWLIKFCLLNKLNKKVKVFGNKYGLPSIFVLFLYFYNFLARLFSIIKSRKKHEDVQYLKSGACQHIFDGWGGDLEKTIYIDDILENSNYNESIHIYYDWDQNYNFIGKNHKKYSQVIINNSDLPNRRITVNYRFKEYFFAAIKLTRFFQREINNQILSATNFIFIFPYYFFQFITGEKNLAKARIFFKEQNTRKIKSIFSVDGDNVLKRARMIIANRLGIMTHSFCHGYQLYPEPLGFFCGKRIHITGIGKKNDLIRTFGYDPKKIVIHEIEKINNYKIQRGREDIMFLFSDFHLSYMMSSSKEFLLFIDLILKLAEIHDNNFVIKFHPGLSENIEHKNVCKWLAKKFVQRSNVRIVYDLYNSEMISNYLMVFSMNVNSTALVYSSLVNVPVYYLETKWSGLDKLNYIGHKKTKNASIYIDNLSSGIDVISGIINRNEMSLNNYPPINNWISEYIL